MCFLPCTLNLRELALLLERHLDLPLWPLWLWVSRETCLTQCSHLLTLFVAKPQSPQPLKGVFLEHRLSPSSGWKAGNFSLKYFRNPMPGSQPYLSPSLHVEGIGGREACGVGRIHHLQLSPMQFFFIANGKESLCILASVILFISLFLEKVCSVWTKPKSW